MNRYGSLVWPAYLVAAMLVVIPFFDATMSVWPLNPGAAQWRFGAIGLFSNAFMLPAAGLLVGYAAAVTLGHKRVLRGLGWLCGVGALLVAILLVSFTLDALQTRNNVQDAAKLGFAVASFTAACKLILAIVALVAFSMASRRAGRTDMRASAPRVMA